MSNQLYLRSNSLSSQHGINTTSGQNQDRAHLDTLKAFMKFIYKSTQVFKELKKSFYKHKAHLCNQVHFTKSFCI